MIARLLKVPVTRGFRALLRYRLRTGRSQMLFIVGHMRSGSTLLVHLLADHEEIIGYGETHRRYDDDTDVALYAAEIYRHFGWSWPRERYVLDKVLHEHHNLTAGLLRAMDARTILLIRRPDASLPSMLDLELPMVSTQERALDYYLGRLEAVKWLATELGRDRCTFITYEGLVEEASCDAVLDHLTSFLSLRSPLRRRYGTMWSTGRRFIGDPSEAILAGEIRKPEREYKHDVDPGIVERAEEAYGECVRHCADALFDGELPWARQTPAISKSSLAENRT
jgi:hypothetical protein